MESLEVYFYAPADINNGREQMTTRFLKHMVPWLKNQNIEFKIYLVCQGWEDFNFNRARLLTIGYLEAEKDGPWDCYTTHDIDRLPLNPNITYHCPPHTKTYHYTTFGLNPELTLKNFTKISTKIDLRDPLLK